MPRIPVLTREELRAVEQAGSGATPALMERAGRSVAKEANGLRQGSDAPVLLVAGPGNNGGDAWVAAAGLAAAGAAVIVLDVTGTEPPAADARAARQALAATSARVVRRWPEGVQPCVVVDGLLGLGLSRDVEAPFASIIHHMNEARAPLLAIDVPSGLDSETGQVRGTCARATRTVTFIAHKAGLHTHDGPDHCGEVVLDALGLEALTQRTGRGGLVLPSVVRQWLPARPRNAHKGSFGTLGIVGGAPGMVGAALLAARAAVLCGAGKTRVALLSTGLTVDPVQPELMIATLEEALAGDVLVVGPGGGAMEDALSRALSLDVPLVVDADGLNAIARQGTLREAVARRTAPTVLTPHPGEAARLLDCTTTEVQADRRAAALALASRFNAAVVLKGTGSICASPAGDWSVNTTGNPGLASGGTGDVLAGMIGALLAQRMEAWQALQYAVCLHGAAADALVARGVGPVGLTASEVALEARRVLNAWESRPAWARMTGS